MLANLTSVIWFSGYIASTTVWRNEVWTIISSALQFSKGKNWSYNLQTSIFIDLLPKLIPISIVSNGNYVLDRLVDFMTYQSLLGYLLSKSDFCYFAGKCWPSIPTHWSVNTYLVSGFLLEVILLLCKKMPSVFCTPPPLTGGNNCVLGHRWRTAFGFHTTWSNS